VYYRKRVVVEVLKEEELGNAHLIWDAYVPFIKKNM
jgi:hypothetical protein